MSTPINQTQAFAYAELIEILNNMEEQYIKKIPQKLMNMFRSNASPEYVNHLDVNIPLEEQPIASETSALLAMLLINYWYESEEQKQELLKVYSENEEKYQKELREKYNPDNIFSSEAASNTITENTSDASASTEPAPINPAELPIDYNSFSWYKKLFTKFRSFIYRLFKKENLQK